MRRCTAVRSGLEHSDRPVAAVHAGQVRLALVARIPVGALHAAAIGLDGEDRGGRQLAHAAQHRVRRRHHGVPAEEVVQRDRVQPVVDLAAREQGRKRRGEAQPAAG